MKLSTRPTQTLNEFPVFFTACFLRRSEKLSESVFRFGFLFAVADKEKVLQTKLKKKTNFPTPLQNRLCQVQCKLVDVLEAVRPHVNLTFGNILAHINTIYVLKTKAGVLAKQGGGYLRLKVWDLFWYGLNFSFFALVKFEACARCSPMFALLRPKTVRRAGWKKKK